MLNHKGDRGNQGNTDVSESMPATTEPPKPFITPGGDLSIPFASDPKYHWWKGGQSVDKTRAEVLARMKAEGEHHTAQPTPS